MLTFFHELERLRLVHKQQNLVEKIDIEKCIWQQLRKESSSILIHKTLREN